MDEERKEELRKNLEEKKKDGKLEVALSPAEKRAAAAAQDEDRRRKKGKKQKKAAADDMYEEAFNFDISMIKMFGVVGINPPTSIDDLEATIKKIAEKKQWYLDNGETKRQEQIEEIRRQADEEDKEYEESASQQRSAAAAEGSRGGRGGRGGYRGGASAGPSRRGRGGYKVSGPRNEFDGGDDEDEFNAYSAPSKAPRKKQQKKEDLKVDDENYPSIGQM